MIHKPVLLEQVIESLEPKEGDTIVDCTVGAGGHSLMILEHITPTGRLIGIDQDEEILKIASDNLRQYKDNINLLYGNFKDIRQIVKKANAGRVDGILYDLGVSSLQFDTPERGFSFKEEGLLDMRMDKAAAISAFDLVNNLPVWELRKIFSKYGQDRFAHKVAALIAEERNKGTIETTKQLSRIVAEAYPYRKRFAKIHPATKIFQALRIAVNNELDILELSIKEAIDILNPGGRIAVISFHSLEDRIVKNLFRRFARERELEIITKKPIRPQSQEISENPRSRSAKLRVAEKLKV
jgi:16S rRNA (cytosine1402-N4)-methyltransferase